MTELSPAAQEVLLNYGNKSRGPGMCISLCQAWMDGDEPCNFACDACRIAAISKPERSGLAAALRAAADQVVPEERKPSADSDYHLMNWTKALDTYYQRKQTRAEILAIAAELESH